MKRYLTLAVMVFTATAALFSLDPKLLEHWQKTMKFGISSQRSGVIKAIQDNKTTEAYSLIMDALSADPNPDVRGQAAYALVGLKLSNEKPWLDALTTESNSDVLRKIAFGASELGVKSASAPLFAILTNRLENPKETQLCGAVIRTLGTLEYTSSTAYLMGVLTNITYPVEIRGAAAVAVGDMKDTKIIPDLKALLENPGEVREVRMYAGYGIGKTGSPQALEILSPYIENENEDLNIRLWAIAGLAFVKDAAVPGKLIEFSRVDNTRIRLEAVKSLAKLKSSEAQDILKFKALFDPDFAVKREAKKALQEQGIDVDKLNPDGTMKTNDIVAAPGLPVTNTKPAPAATTAPKTSPVPAAPATAKPAASPKKT